MRVTKDGEWARRALAEKKAPRAAECSEVIDVLFTDIAVAAHRARKAKSS